MRKQEGEKVHISFIVVREAWEVRIAMTIIVRTLTVTAQMFR